MVRSSLAGQVLFAGALVLAGCDGPGDAASGHPRTHGSSGGDPLPGAVLGTESAAPDLPRGVVTLGFAGDVHFEYHLRGWLGQPAGAFGSMRPVLEAPDLMMVNLESSLTERGAEEPKEYNFRVSRAALGLLDGAGVDLLTLANNHGADYGGVGLKDTLAAVRTSPVPVIGVGRDVDAAFRPYRISIRGTDIAVFAASTRNDRTAKAWSAGPGRPGVAVAVTPSPVFLEQVSRASRRDDVVAVYLHWGREGRSCPTPGQVRYAQALSDAGADIVLGSHAHVLLGAGWMGDTYVAYGLGNFLWYHPRPPETGVLSLRIKDGEVVGDSWVPGEQHADGPELLPRAARADAVADWRRLRGCSGLAAGPSG